jgi:myosin-3
MIDFFGALSGKFNHNVRSKYYVKSKSDDLQFTIHHYAGKVQYNAKNFLQKNRNFLPPEVIHLLRQSRLEVIRYLFQCPLARTGNLFALGQHQQNGPNNNNGFSPKYSPGGSSGRVDDFHMVAMDVSQSWRHPIQ